MGENPAALRAAVFSLSPKNLRGAFKRPPPAGRGLRWDGHFKCTYVRKILMVKVRMREVRHDKVYKVSPG